MSQLHKKFTDSEVVKLIERYLEKKIKRIHLPTFALLFVMQPHADYFYYSFFIINLINNSMFDIYPS